MAVVVGPNGSGKSNVSDSILWATGSMSPGELRAEKPDDVLFAGSAGARAVDACEVELIFDNADGAWPELPFAEVAVSRKLARGGEGQYLINRAVVRRIDLVELLSDVGLGGGLRSVISQGRVETVLNSRPAERRELVEEAAGLGRFKRRRHRAELKLARVAIQVERARDLEDEVQKRLRPLALQATAAERAEKVGVEIARLQAAIATLDLARLSGQQDELDVRRAAVAAERKALEEQIAALVAERERAEEELTDSAGSREQATAAVYLLRSSGERIALRRETAARPRRAAAGRSRSRSRLRPVGVGRARDCGAHRRGRGSGCSGRACPAPRRGGGALGSCRRPSNGRRRRPWPASSTRRSRRVGEPRLSSPAKGATRCSRCAARHRCSRSATSRHRGCSPSCRPSLPRLAHAPRARPRPSSAWPQTKPTPPPALRPASVTTCRRAPRSPPSGSQRWSIRWPSGKGCRPPPVRWPRRASGSFCSWSSPSRDGERAVAAALGHRASAVMAESPRRGLELIERARAAGLGPVRVLVGRDPSELVARAPGRCRRHVARLRGSRRHAGGDRLGSRAWRAVVRGRGGRGGAARARGAAARAPRRGRRARRRRRVAAEQVAESAAAKAQAAEAAFRPVAHLRNVRRGNPALLERLAAGAERLDETLRVAAAAAARLEAPLAERTRRFADDLQAHASHEGQLRSAMAEIDGPRRGRRAAGQRPGRRSRRRGRRAALRGGSGLCSRPRSRDRRRGSRRSRTRGSASADRGRSAGDPATERDGARPAPRGRRTARGAPSRSESSATRHRYGSAPRRRLPARPSSAPSCGGWAPKRCSCARGRASRANGVGAIDVELARVGAETDEARRRLAASMPSPPRARTATSWPSAWFAANDAARRSGR